MAIRDALWETLSVPARKDGPKQKPTPSKALLAMVNTVKAKRKPAKSKRAEGTAQKPESKP
jgi:hypothetical protein